MSSELNNQRTEQFISALWHHDEKTIATLAKVGFNPDFAVYKTTPLLEAIRLDNQPVLDLLLTQVNANPNFTYPGGMTPLGAAVSWNCIVSVKKLLAHPKIDVNYKMPKVLSPLSMACIRDNAEITELLLEAPGIDIWLHNADGTTALTYAVQQAKFMDSRECLELLVEHGAIPDHPLRTKRKANLQDKADKGSQKQKIHYQVEEVD